MAAPNVLHRTRPPRGGPISIAKDCTMLAHTRRLVRRALLTLLLLLLTAWAVIAYFAWQAAPLQLWHTVVPPELSADELDSSDWQAYLTREAELFELVAT